MEDLCYCEGHFIAKQVVLDEKVLETGSNMKQYKENPEP